MSRKRLEDITGDLLGVYSKAQPGTILHFDELLRRGWAVLRSHPFGLYAADGQIYFLRGEKHIPSLALTRVKENLVLRHIDDAFHQLATKHNYYPSPEEAQKAINAKDTSIIDLTQLRLTHDK